MSWLPAACVVALALALAGCGGAQPHNAAPSRQAVRAAFRDSPAKLAAVHDEADRLLAGAAPALKARLRALRGHPVVVNEWASWCEPCRSEFPVFQRVAVRDGRSVAFLGVDVADTRANAGSFLKRFPVTYPSYFDPHRTVEAAIQTLRATPQTFFFGRDGRQAYDHAGPYTSDRALARDIRYYLHP